MIKRIFVAAYALFILLGVVFANYAKANESMVSFGGKDYRAIVADTEAAQEKGLGGQPGLAVDQTMLFVFSDNSGKCFWMKDMQFSIDIMWVDARKRVTHIERNVAPATYPDAFCPKQPTKYVIETNAHATDAVAVGDTIHIRQ